MPVLFAYLLKLSICLAVVFLFYRLVLEKLTFYNWNRWFLVGYTLLSFFIPFIDITPVLRSSRLSGNELMSFIPVVDVYTAPVTGAINFPEPVLSSGWTKWDWGLFILLSGVGILLLQFAVRFFSFLQLRRKATLLSDGKTKLYQVDQPIIPFSFGNAIFINPSLHGEAELQEIIRHEFVHVKQKHTHDIILSEMLCMLNWYNPFAWLIRKAIRQNLEFIADHQVLRSGIDKKQYQYLLLKVIGNNHFSIASQFNFSSLKKRIAMMNKMKSARVHLLKFLFLLPLAAVCLLAFRNRAIAESPDEKDNPLAAAAKPDTTALPRVDTLFWHGKEGVVIGDLTKLEEPDVYGNRHLLLLDGKEVSTYSGIDKRLVRDLRILFAKEAKKKYGDRGKYGVVELYTNALSRDGDGIPFIIFAQRQCWYGIDDNKGNSTVVVKDKSRKEVERVLLTKWNENKAYYEDKYGEIPPPPPAVEPPPPPAPPVAFPLPAHIKSIQVDNDRATVVLKNGSREEFDLNDPKQKADFEKRYRRAVPPTPPPPVAPKEPREFTIVADSITWLGKERVLRFKGSALIQETRNDISVSASLAHMNGQDALVMINGTEADQDRDYINNSGGIYKVTSLTSEEAIKKYGDKGKRGAIEINAIADTYRRF